MADQRGEGGSGGPRIVGGWNDQRPLDHISRDKMTARIFFDKPGDLDKHLERMVSLREEITHTIYGRWFGNTA
jgi:hypothetical protein